MLHLKCGNMKKSLLTLLYSFSLFSWSQGIAQVASDTIGCVPLLVEFVSPSDTFSRVLWDFKDGAKSQKLTANHVFSLPGTYEVTLYNHDSLILTKKIEVYPPLEVSIAADIDRGCAPLSVVFTNNTMIPTGISVLEYFWDFGDGNGSEFINPNHQYTEIGDYDVTLNLVTNIEQCNTTKTFPHFILIDQKQNVQFRIDSIKPDCTFPTFVTLTNTGDIDTSFSYKWVFGNGQTSNLPQPPPIQYDKDSLYTIILEVDNKQGCISKYSRNVNINFWPEIKVDFNASTCVNRQVLFNNLTKANNFIWDFGPDAVPPISTTKSPVVSFSTEGQKIVKLKIISDAGCVQDTFFTINNTLISAEFTIEPEMICELPVTVLCVASESDFTKYIWNGQSGLATHEILLDGVNRDSFYYNELDTLFINLSVEDNNGCVNQITKIVPFQLPNAQFSINEHEGIAPFYVTIEDHSESACPIVKWIINWGDGTINEYDSISVKTAGHYYVESGKYYINMHIINDKGCEDKYYGAWIEVHDPIEFINLPSNGICTPQQVEFCYREQTGLQVTSVPPQVDAVRINFGPLLAHCDQNNYYIGPIYNDPGYYPISVTLENGGQFFEILTPGLIQVKGPKAQPDYKINCEDKLKVSFFHNSIKTSNVEWLIEGQKFYSDQVEYTFPGPGNYPVKFFAINNQTDCPPDSVELMIRLRNIKADIVTTPDWCFNEEFELISTGSDDEVVGCGMGYIWSFPETDKATIISDLDTIKTMLPPGIHPIILEVRDVNGCKAFDTVVVTSHYIQADFTMDKTHICNPSDVLFTDQSVADTTIVSYYWSFEPNTNVPDITHRFENQTLDIIQVFLIIRDTIGCESSAEKQLTTYKPESTLTHTKILCEEGTAFFKAADYTVNGSYLTYEWFIDSVEVSNAKEFSKDGFSPGTHQGFLIITEASSQCKNDYDFEFYVAKTPEAMISGIDDSIFCYPKSFQLFGDSSVIDQKDQVTYLWTYSTGRSSKKINPVETFGKGEFTIHLTVRSIYQCESHDEVSIRLVGPEGGMTADKDKICKGDIVTFTMINPKDVSSYFWDFGQGETNNNISPVQYKYDFYPPDGSTFATLVLYGSQKNCQIINTLPINFYQVHAGFVPDTVCGNAMEIKNISFGDEIALWEWGGKSFNSSDSIVKIIVDSPGYYPVTLTIMNNQLGCVDTFTSTLGFLKIPELNLPSEISACSNNISSFLIDPNLNYAADPPGIMTVKGDSLFIIAKDNLNLDVTAMSLEGCTNRTIVNINTAEWTVLDIQDTIYACQSQNSTIIRVDSLPGSQIVWETETGDVGQILSCKHCANPQIQQSYAGFLYANVINDLTCEQNNYTFYIPDYKIEIPNVFSPNGDGMNDTFRPVCAESTINEIIEIHELSIVNRWGKVLFESNTPWDGNYKGQPANAEVYYFTMTYSLNGQCPESVKGDLTLLR